jgi:uncharacterized protein (TIGR02145 family)
MGIFDFLKGKINASAEPLSKTLTDIDENEYQTIKIGKQVWTVENLKTTKYNDGTPMLKVLDNSEWANLSTGAYCYYDNDISNKEKYGALYNWYAVATGKLAPKGWHVPTEADWAKLEKYLIANSYNWDGTKKENKVAKALAAKTDWEPDNHTGTIGNDLTKNNRSGFSALPGGSRSNHGDFRNKSRSGVWWHSGSSAYYFIIGNNNEAPNSYGSYKQIGLSVRLIMDN